MTTVTGPGQDDDQGRGEEVAGTGRDRVDGALLAEPAMKPMRTAATRKSMDASVK